MYVPSLAHPLNNPHSNGGHLNLPIHGFQFIQRARVLSFYRTILRSIRRIPDPATRAETHRYARGEFERHRDVTDLVCGLLSRWKQPIPTSGVS